MNGSIIIKTISFAEGVQTNGFMSSVMSWHFQVIA